MWNKRGTEEKDYATSLGIPMQKQHLYYLPPMNARDLSRELDGVWKDFYHANVTSSKQWGNKSGSVNKREKQIHQIGAKKMRLISGEPT